jgi:hypothetical protein
MFYRDLPDGTAASLGEYLLPEELAALQSRLEALLSAGRFPLPPEDRRPWPYPPV